ncbi:hypothetical protein Tco_0919250 [Tanacetum coccineum]
MEYDLKQTKLTYGAAYTKLIMKVKKLEHKVKSSKARRRVRLVISEDEDELEDPSKQRRKIAQIDEDEGISLNGITYKLKLKLMKSYHTGYKNKKEKDTPEADKARLLKLSFDEVKVLFETTMKRVNTFTPMESDDTVPKVVAGSLKIDAEQELN